MPNDVLLYVSMLFCFVFFFNALDGKVHLVMLQRSLATALVENYFGVSSTEQFIFYYVSNALRCPQYC